MPEKGDYYCQKYEDSKSQFSERTQKVLVAIKTCLHEKLQGAVLESCQQADEVFSKSHVDCYLESGFCQVPFLEKIKIFKIGYRMLNNKNIYEAFNAIKYKCLF